MKIEIKKLSKNLRSLREKKKLTQEELAKDLGVTRQSIIALEQGRCLPSLALAVSVAELFDMSFEQMFSDEINSFHQGMMEMNESNAVPRVNIAEQEKNIIIVADLAGVREEDVKIEVAKELVIISGRKNTENIINVGGFIRHEIISGNFSRTIPLPFAVNKDKAEAKLKDGILIISIPKIAKIKPRIIKLKIKGD